MDPAALLVGTLAAAVFGMSKTGVPSLGAFGMALLATAVDPVAAAGIALPVLICGDLLALRLYAREARWGLLRALLPSVVLGLAAGWAALRLLDGPAAGRLVGTLLLLAGGWELVRREQRRRAAARRPGAGPVPAAPSAQVPLSSTGRDTRPAHAAGAGGPPVDDRLPAAGTGERVARAVLGAGAGLSTMVANAGGPMMSLYLVRARLSAVAFLGTNAWFFFVVNVVKVPFSVGLGLITVDSVRLSAALLPGLLLGAAVGRVVVRRMSLDLFQTVVLVATVLAGAWLVLR
ncbi:TSUP family transporter [Cellulomonas endophytica]|uniref:TSUP family transporter n=1 Tax=Cellulomonas endophytica TaxID=2494735 RepID=UPI001013BDD6|nr:TSUP family transporter [Cellulomonas endophytica]